MRKFVVILTIILLYSVACKKEDFLWDLPKKIAPCSFLYSVWTPCLNSIQTRTYTPGPSGCSGTPPSDSIQRTCAPCKFVYSAWTSCSNNVQTRTYNLVPLGCSSIGLPPADSIQKNCTLVLNGQGVWDRDMNFYETKIYDNQNWFSKNLEVSTYRNGDSIPQVQNANAWANLTTGAWCYYLNDAANGLTYGKLYNWYAVKDQRGLAPSGYHIPTDAEWAKLTNWLGGEIVAGGKMKEQGLSHWNAPNFGATNISLFSALPGGARDYGGYCNWIGVWGFWWTSSEKDANYIWNLAIHYNDDYSSLGAGIFKSSGLSVRCIKD